MRGVYVLIGSCALAGISAADIVYTVSSGSTPDKLAVSIEFKAPAGPVKLQMPNWAPGSYVYSNYSSRVTGFKAQGAEFSKENDYTWVLKPEKAGKISVSYEVPTSFGDGIGHYSGPAAYMYLVDRKTEKCILNFKFPKGTRIATGLDARKEHQSYVAPDYDVLADNPVTYGDFMLDTYTVAGKTHSIAYRGGPAKNVDRAYTIKVCEYITKMQGDFFGGFPYNKYVWHFAVNDRPDGAGGLEHLSSTQITLASGVGPRAVSVCSHEFFHLWNVKRIRSKVLGPFDYTTLPQTGALWWLEGVTDYYANTLLPRYGWNTKEDLYADLLRNVRSVRARKERFEVGPYEASYRVRDAANGRGNSQGYKVSYYDTGYLAGFCLDVELLDATNGKESLDSVELALWNQAKTQPNGFEEGEIRRLCREFGGLRLAYFYDKIIMKPGEMPVEAQLAKLGLEIVDKKEEVAELGFGVLPSAPDKSPKVGEVSSKGVELKTGDLVTSINGIKVAADTFKDQAVALQTVRKSLKIGDEVLVEFVRGGKTTITKVKIGSATRESKVVAEKKDATPEQKRLRKLFESKRRSS